MSRTHPDPVVRITFGHGAIALPLVLIARIETVSHTVAVAGAPTGVFGVAEARGRLLTLLDPRVFAPPTSPDSVRAGCPQAAWAGLALRLAPPLDHLALLLPAGFKLVVAPRRLDADLWIDAAAVSRTLDRCAEALWAAP